MATEEIFEKLRSLQDVLAKKIELERDITYIPKMLVTQEELLQRLKKEYIEMHIERSAAKTAEAELKNLLFEAESTREKAEKHMDAISTQREYENLDKEIHDASEKESQYRKEIKQKEQKMRDLDSDMEQKKGLIDQQEAELSQAKSRVESELADRKKLLVELEAEEKELTKNMDEELLFKFERIVKKKGGNGIVSIKGGVCSSCHMILPVQFANSVRGGKEIVSCPYCSSILFYEESSDGEENYFDEDTAGSLSDLEDLDDEEFVEDEYEEDDEKVMDYEDLS
ncbi:MAG: C4-type zinc ribbon domain-containing protein [Spirochaetaceae bacterium]|jgi:predicted  nucleic acid-binding Zn-ribbon protein|nr:C4-type zinc ribbon domain-containing protein [Spirochaetaceae bacterium]